jgi:lipid II:glycine glycyltransferase (peptidoglycan interpeptide bridge formation enzyme)
MTLVTFSEWQQFTAAWPDLHFLQTAEWGQLKAAFGWDAQRIICDGQGIQILFRRLPLGFTIAYAPKPLGFENPAEISPQLRDEIDKLCRKKRAIVLKIEPDTWQDVSADTWGLRISPHHIQPPRTSVISLVGSDDEILARMKQKCRYNVRLAEKKGITVGASDDLTGFHQLMQVTGGRDGFGVHSLEYYQKAYHLFHSSGRMELLLAEFEGKPLAALMVFAVGRRSWYLYGASNDVERNRMPTYLLQWHAIQWARSKGCLEYDLWGVPDQDENALEAQFENRHDGLWGVYRFKRGFGGQILRSAAALDRVYNPWLYRLYLWRMAKSE